jgi:ketopantoate reductase
LRRAWRSKLRIVIFGAGVQGTVFAVRLSTVGHQVTLVARSGWAAQLRREGVSIQDAGTAQIRTRVLPVIEKLPPDLVADMCLVTVRRDQMDLILPDLVGAIAIPQVVLLGNHANRTDHLLTILGRSRTVLAFPGVAGYREGAMIRYLDIPQQHTVVEERAPHVSSLFREAGFRVDSVRDMDAWLQRHAVFITAIAGALYENGCDARRMAQNTGTVRRFVLAVREGWAAQDRKGVGAAPLALRTIMCWVPLPLSVMYWSRLLASSRGDLYFARHVRHAPAEMASLADDVGSSLRGPDALELRTLVASINNWQPKSGV